MAGWSKFAATASVAVTALLLLAPAAHAQGKRSRAAPATEPKQWVDDKAYKAALDRIPDPKKPYDPWGQVHDAQSGAKSSGKPN